jgi:phytoene dehydrogenase-like protein
MQSASDPRLRSGAGHVVSVFAQYYPYELDSSLSHESERSAFADRVLALLDRHLPGFGEAVLERTVETPLELERRFGFTGGHIFHGELHPDRVFANRPFRGHRPYRTPISGLYLCGSSAPPGGCVSGIPGRNAGKAVLDDLRTG